MDIEIAAWKRGVVMVGKWHWKAFLCTVTPSGRDYKITFLIQYSSDGVWAIFELAVRKFGHHDD